MPSQKRSAANLEDVVKTINFTVDMPNVLREMFDHFNAPNAGIGMCEAIDRIRVGMARIAIRAVELGDAELLEELEGLGCVHANKKT